MQLIAAGKWSKAKKDWTMVVALRRPSADSSKHPGTPAKRPTPPSRKS